MNTPKEDTPFTAIYDGRREELDNNLRALLSSPPLQFIAGGATPMKRRADVYDAGTRRLRSSNGAEYAVPLVLCARSDNEVVYRYASIAGEVPVGLRQCGPELRLWQRVAQRGTNVVPCRYAEYERGATKADDCHWFLLELPPIKMSDYLPGLLAQLVALPAHDILQMLRCVVDGVRSLYSFNFIVGPRALTVDNLWIAAGPMNVLLENGIASLADEGDRQWRDGTPLDLLARFGAAAETAERDDALGEFTYLHVAYPDGAQLAQWQRLARRATCACLRQLVVLTHDLLLRCNSGRDYVTVCGGGGPARRSPADYIAARIRAATDFVDLNGEFKYPLMFMSYCRDLADGEHEPELVMNSVNGVLHTMIATMRSKCPLPEGYCTGDLGDRLLLIHADEMR